MIYTREYHILHATWTPSFCAWTAKKARVYFEKNMCFLLLAWIVCEYVIHTNALEFTVLLNRVPNQYRLQFVKALPNWNTKINRIVAFVSAFFDFGFFFEKFDRLPLRRVMIAWREKKKRKSHPQDLNSMCSRKKSRQVSNWNSLQWKRVKV